MTETKQAPVPFVDLSAIHAPLHDRFMTVIEEVVRTNRFILGAGVSDFEDEFAAFCNSPHALGVSSGTDALVIALMGLGIGPGDEVITTAFTYAATAMAIVRVGATPVFADIDPESFNLDADAAASAVTDKTKAILPVHLFGRACDMDAMQRLAKEHDLAIIEDAAQAVGAEWAGQRVGTMSDMGCFSFFPAKNLGCFGDGGAVTVRDPERFAHLKQLRVQGASKRYFHAHVGGNFRLDAMQAAVLRVKLPELEGWTSTRQDNAFRYQDLFYSRALTDALTLPAPGTGRHVYNQYTVRIPGGKRSAVFEALKAKHIGCAVYYPIPLHQQPAFESFGGGKGSLPETERAAAEVLSLPVAPGLTAQQQEQVVDAIMPVLG